MIKLARQWLGEMIAQGADVLDAGAGYTGVGLLQQAQESRVLAIGVDIDQYNSNNMQKKQLCF